MKNEAVNIRYNIARASAILEDAPPIQSLMDSIARARPMRKRTQLPAAMCYVHGRTF